MGVAVADHIEGPYKDLGIFLKSGMWGEPSEDGEIYDPIIHPNVIDPHVFYDKNGKLWMVYGSYSGVFLSWKWIRRRPSHTLLKGMEKIARW